MQEVWDLFQLDSVTESQEEELESPVEAPEQLFLALSHDAHRWWIRVAQLPLSLQQWLLSYLSCNGHLWRPQLKWQTVRYCTALLLF